MTARPCIYESTLPVDRNGPSAKMICCKLHAAGCCPRSSSTGFAHASRTALSRPGRVPTGSVCQPWYSTDISSSSTACGGCFHLCRSVRSRYSSCRRCSEHPVLFAVVLYHCFAYDRLLLAVVRIRTNLTVDWSVLMMFLDRKCVCWPSIAHDEI